MSAPVVVGVDGSPSSLDAVEVAVREARLRGCGLKVVHAFWPSMHVPVSPSLLGPAEAGLREMVERLVAEAVQRARAADPDVKVAKAVVMGEPLRVLEAQSREAALVVVGSRDLGSFRGLLLRSTAVHLAAHARCPVMVVRDRPGPAGWIVLGADGSPAGEAAVDFAFAEAALRGTRVIALHAWTPWSVQAPPPQDSSMPCAYGPGTLADGEERLLAEAVAGRRERYPGVTVEYKVVRSGAREALTEASKSAELLVVGARGRGGIAGLLLGSVSQALLHHAHCPVVVARARAGPDGPARPRSPRRERA
ncbi:universal stress protein [Streptomyces sp. NBRC 110611]|uniref:universal stress protein n=1 Tax=Streptomyces sp. NBRC 110611 TaxID=1621259 RepID=UPI00082D6CCC|nr:universal stress protein [Streptomyces sp. NBRC 110611]